MSDNLKLYKINTNYINYLKKFQRHIWENKENHKTRPYVGIVLEINNYKYYAPLSSPKSKHISMKERLDFIKINHKNELKCVINLNNIIPINDSDITLIDIDNEEEQYSNLLKVEIQEIRKKQKTIIYNSKILYNKVTIHKKDNLKLVEICYDFLLLEQKMHEYQLYKEEISSIDT